MRLTDKAARALAAPARGNKLYYDSDVPGFACRITASNARAFVLNYHRKADGLERRMTIGTFPAWSVVQARARAQELRREVDGGGDPVGEHRAEREAPTIADLCERFIEEHVAKKRPNTQREYRQLIRREIVPGLGRLKVASVEYEHIERWHAKISQRAPSQANRALACLSTAMVLAIKWRMRPDNPVRSVKRNAEHARERYLTGEELDRLTAALAADPNQDTADVFRLLLLTGARRSEVVTATWDQFDLSTGVWTKPPDKTKQAKRHRVPLNAPACALLAARWRRRDPAMPWVFPGRRGGRPCHDVKYVWQRVCATAAITGLRIHDLRHSYASQAVNAGFSLPVIGKLLGHSLPRTTARYAHLYDDILKEATERVGAAIERRKSAKIVPLERRRSR